MAAENQAKVLVHELYNDLRQNQTPGTEELEGVLLKVYQQLDTKEVPPLVNRLVNYLRFAAFNQKIKLSPTQEQLIADLAEIGNKAGLNGVYRSNYGDPDQF